MKFQRDDNKVKEFSGGFIRETGFYSCTITKAYEQKSQNTLSEAIAFEVVTDTGSTGRFSLWVVGKEGTSLDKNGKELSAVTSVNDLMILLDIDELTSKPGKVKIYDFDLKQDVDQRKMVFSELLNQQIGIIFEMRDNTWNGKTTTRPEFAGFYDAETRQSSAEKLGESEAVAWQRNLDYLTGDAHIIKQAVNQPTSPQNSAPVDPYATFNEDIPF
jgi:hypothetical protein